MFRSLLDKNETAQAARFFGRPARVLGALGVLGIGVAAVVGGGAAGAATKQAPRTLVNSAYISPTGNGTTCSASAPCATLQTALNVTADGATIYAMDGTYPAQTVTHLAANQTPITVTVAPAPGQNPIFSDTTIKRPDINFTDLTFHGNLILRRGDNTVNNTHIVNGTLLVRDDNTTITNNLIEGGAAHDGINIAGYPTVVHNITVRNNTVRDIGKSSGTQQHPDCIQIFDADHVTITQNNLYNCWNSGLTFSPGAHHGITNVLVQANFIQGCIPTRQTCGNGGAAMDARTTNIQSATIANNTFGTGSVRLPYHSGVTAPNNIVGYLSVANPCTTSFTNSLIGGYPTWACKNGAPGATTTTRSGNTLGTATFVDPNNGDLHLATPLTNTTLGNTTYPAIGADLTSRTVSGVVPTTTTIGAGQAIGG